MKINPNDVVFEAFSGHGPGGANRNKVMCCIRATHIPTGLRAIATQERSQSKNKKAALATLQVKLNKLCQTRRDIEKKLKRETKPAASFGSQIRTYRLVGNCQIVLDHRSGKTGSTDVLFKGILDELLYYGATDEG